MAKPRGENYNEREIRVVGVPANTANEIKNIAENLGVKMSDFIKPHLKEIVGKYPENMRVKREF